MVYENTNEGRRNCAGESGNSADSDFCRSCLGSTLRTRSDHVRFQETSFPEDVVIRESLNDNSEDSFSDLLADFNGMLTIDEDFRLNNGDKSVSLADSSISSQTPSILLDGLFRRASISRDLQDSSPFSKTATNSVEFLGHCIEGVESHSGSLIISSRKNLDSLVNLNSGEDTFLSKKLNEIGSARRVLLSSFRVEDNTGDMFLKSGSGEEQFSVCLSVYFSVFNS